MHGFLDRGAHVPRGRFSETGRFGRMLPYLRSLREFDPGPLELGKPGGAMDGGDAFDPSQDNDRIRAGYTFLGQFIDHDLTFDPTSVLEQQIDPGATRNFRTPVLELDSLYGLGPAQQPYLYDRDKPFQFLLGPDGHDLPRNSQGRALIGDPRNDENVIISQLHLLMLKFHNKVYATETGGGPDSVARFEEAQRIVRWHYQWIVVNEFLARTVGAETMGKTLTDMPFRFPGEPFMPLEFSVAAYRFGHSQVRPAYLLSAPGIQPPRAASIFPLRPGMDDDPAFPIVGDLRGGKPVAENLRVEWAAFFGPDALASKQIDRRISSRLLMLPFSVVSPEEGEDPAGVAAVTKVRSLASRNLQRGLDARLPSGQTVAAHLGIPQLTEAQLWAGVDGGKGRAPLWYYILCEAEMLTQGRMLAGVGAAIVSRVFAAIMMADKASYLVQDPSWQPHLGKEEGRFTMSDLVNYTLGTELGQEDLSTLPVNGAPVDVAAE
jgi:hypothetical protein